MRPVLFCVLAAALAAPSCAFAQYITNITHTVETNIVSAPVTNAGEPSESNASATKTTILTNAVTNVTYRRYLSPSWSLTAGAPMYGACAASVPALYLELSGRYRFLEWLGARAHAAYAIGNAIDAIAKRDVYRPNVVLGLSAEAFLHHHGTRKGFEQSLALGFAYSSETKDVFALARVGLLGAYPGERPEFVFEFFACAVLIPLTHRYDFSRTPFIDYLVFEIVTVGVAF